HGAVHGRRGGESEALAHVAAVLLRQIPERCGDDLRRALRRRQFQRPHSRHLFSKGNCGAGPGLRGPCRISVSRLARAAGTKEVHLQFQNLEMKSSRLSSSNRARCVRGFLAEVTKGHLARIRWSFACSLVLRSLFVVFSYAFFFLPASGRVGGGFIGG